MRSHTLGILLTEMARELTLGIAPGPGAWRWPSSFASVF